MPVGAAIGAVGSVASAGIGYLGAQQASKAQAQQAQNALNAQNSLFTQGKDALTGLFNQGLGIAQPFINMGQQAGSTLQNLLTPGPNQTNVLSQLPGFKFAQDWGQKAVQNIGSTLGLGGNTLAQGAQFATGTAQQGFSTLAGLLQNLTNTGATTAQGAFGNAVNTGQSILGGAVNTGSNLGQQFSNLGNAQAAGILGGANALSGGVQGVSNALSLPYLLSAFKNGGANGSPNPGIYNGSGGGNGGD